MKYFTLAFITCTSLLSGCNLMQSEQANCDSPESKQLAQQVLSDTLNQTSLVTLKQWIETGENPIDVSKLRATVDQIQFDLSDVRTTRSDPQSSKKFCTAVMSAKIPANLINDANTTRTLQNQPKIADVAVLNDLKLESSTLSHDLEYSVQPTDGGKKLYVEIQNNELSIQFISSLLMDALQKNALQAQHAEIQQQQMQEQQYEAEQQAAEDAQNQQAAFQQQADRQAYQQLQVSEAQTQLDQANQKLNLIWNSTSKAIRNDLLAEQRVWLKKRELECRLNSTDAAPEQQELVRIRCETGTTLQRASALKSLIDNAEAQAPQQTRASTPSQSPSTSRSSVDDITQQVTDENARKMAQNIQILQRQLSQH